jgi:hypothetical protein
LDTIGENIPWAIEIPAQIFYSHGVQATFFIDVYEYTYFGEKKFRQIVETLLKYNQDIQLHTHPAWGQDSRDNSATTRLRLEKSCYDPTRPWMHLYSLDEQIDILMHGIEKLENWGAPPPVAHRAGAYGLNRNTLHALKKVGINIDSSMFNGHLNCKYTCTHNKPEIFDGILQLPVTYFKRSYNNRLYSRLVPNKQMNIKTDLDWCELSELLQFMDEARKNGLSFMNLFMHSYSLIKFDRNFRNFQPDKRDREKLENFLQFCYDANEVRIKSIKQICAECSLYNSTASCPFDASIISSSSFISCFKFLIVIFLAILESSTTKYFIYK